MGTSIDIVSNILTLFENQIAHFKNYTGYKNNCYIIVSPEIHLLALLKAANYLLIILQVFFEVFTISNANSN